MNRGSSHCIMHDPSIYGVSIERNLGEEQDGRFEFSLSEQVLHVESHTLHIKSEESLYSPIAEVHLESRVVSIGVRTTLVVAIFTEKKSNLCIFRKK